MADATAAPAQRRWRAACPNCGASVEFASPASASAVCSFCRSSLLRQDDVLLRTGESAELFSDYSPLQIGTQGTLQGEPFTVLGRLQLAYAGGSWNEWHAFFDRSGKSAFLSEDNGRFVLSWPLALAQAPAVNALVLGAQQLVDGQAWRVAALTEARLHAAEGELPEPPRLGQAVYVAELRSARDEVGSLEYLDGQAGQAAARWSVGRAVALAELALVNTREESAAAWAGRSLQCPGCGAAVQPQLAQSLSVTCGQCQALIDLSGGSGQALHHHAQAMGREPAIPLGRSGQFAIDKGGERLPWQLVGYLERSTVDDGETFAWREYLLFNRQQGFAFLVDSEDGWSLVRVLTGAPDAVGAGVQWQGRQFNLKERYPATTTRVLGEFYWKVEKDQASEVADYAQGELLLSCERNAQEISWSLGRKVDAAEVIAGFGLDPAQGRRVQRDVGLGGGRDGLKGLAVFGLLALLLVGLVRACSSEPCDSTRSRFGAQSLEYQQCMNQQRGGAYYRGPVGGSGGGYSGGSGGFGGGGHK